MNKKIISIVSAIVVAATLFSGCSSSTGTGTGTKSSSTAKAIKIGLSTDQGGLNDKSFNQAADTGIKKAVSELGNIDYKPIESHKKDDYQANLQSLVDYGSDIVFAIGFQMADDLQTIAKKYPDKKFAIVDNSYAPNQPKNIVSLDFKEQEGSFLMGVIAAKTTKTNKLGFVGGMDSELIHKFAAGYIAGARTINPNIEVKVTYTNDFADTTKGKEQATTLYNAGCDIVYHAAGGAGLGVFQAAEDAKKSGKTVWAIGVDQDQAVTVPEDADVILTSMIKRVDSATYDTVKDLKNGKFDGGQVKEFGLKENGVGYAPTSSKNVAKDVLDLVDKYKQAIIDGKIVVPTKVDDANKFTTTPLS